MTMSLTSDRYITQQQLLKRWQNTQFAVSRSTLNRWRDQRRNLNWFQFKSNKHIYYSLNDIIQFEHSISATKRVPGQESVQEGGLKSA